MKRSNIIAIIQARMGSSRLPGKVMMQIAGKPMLWHVIDRVKRSKLVDQAVVATSIKKSDDKIADFCQENNIEVFRGLEIDVLDRYYKCAKKYNTDYAVRITADCPLIDPTLIDKLIKKFMRGNYDHMGIATGAAVSMQKIKRYPQGLDASIFTFKALETAWKSAKNPVDREHVSVYIWQNPDKFKLGPALKPKKDYSNYRLTVDWPEDLELVRKIYKRLYKFDKNFDINGVINILEKNPSLSRINSKYLGKTTENFWKQKLMSEFQNIKSPKKTKFKNINAVIVPSAEETEIKGENGLRIKTGLNLVKKINKNCQFIFLGTKIQNRNLGVHIKKNKINVRIIFPTSRKEASTRTQIKDLANFAKKLKLSSIIVSHAYHIPRIKRYCKKYFVEKNKTYFCPVGSVEKQKNQIDLEIKKIIKYSSKEDIPLFI